MDEEEEEACFCRREGKTGLMCRVWPPLGLFAVSSCRLHEVEHSGFKPIQTGDLLAACWKRSTRFVRDHRVSGHVNLSSPGNELRLTARGASKPPQSLNLSEETCLGFIIF